MYDLIIIGGGPAGITAGIYASRQKLKTLLITKEFGGQMVKKAVFIENYPGFEKISNYDLIDKFVSHLKAQQIEIRKDEVKEIKKDSKGFLVITENKDNLRSKTVIISSGSDPRPLEVPGEKEFLGKGVSYCALCDGPIFKDKVVSIIGGGNAGFETAFFLANYVKKIYILEYGSQVKADKISQELVRKTKKAEIMTGVALKEIKGDRFVNSIIYQDLNPVRDSNAGEKTQSKQISNGVKTKKIKTLEVSAVFVEIGYQPATSFVKDLVDFNEIDEIKIEFETCQTKTPGLFAAGDVNVGRYKQIITACGEGAKAALAAYEYIKKNGPR